VSAEHVAGSAQALERPLGLLVQFRRAAAEHVEIGSDLDPKAIQLGSFRLTLGARLGKRLPFQGGAAAELPEALALPRHGLLPRGDIGREAVELYSAGLEFLSAQDEILLHSLAGCFDGATRRAERSPVRRQIPRQIVERLRAAVQILGATAELFLKCLAYVFRLGQGRLALADGRAIRFETALEIECLRHAAFEKPGLFRELRCAKVQLSLTIV
jgi:hypothetical protein